MALHECTGFNWGIPNRYSLAAALAEVLVLALRSRGGPSQSGAHVGANSLSLYAKCTERKGELPLANSTPTPQKKKKMSPRASSARGRRTSWPSTAGMPAVCLSLRTWKAGEIYRWPKVRYSGGFLQVVQWRPCTWELRSHLEVPPGVGSRRGWSCAGMLLLRSAAAACSS